MKRTLFLMTLSVLFVIMGATTSRAQAVDDNNKEIVLTESKDDDTRDTKGEKDIEPGNAEIVRSMAFRFAYAYLFNDIVSVDFTQPFSAVRIIITNTATGETIYSEEHDTPAALNIDLNGEKRGDYLIEIEADGLCLEGNLSL